MKRYGHLFEKICSLDNILAAHRNARNGKLHYREVQLVDENPERYAKSIKAMLEHRIYTTSPYRVFTKIDGPKPREIYVLPYYPDRIIQWATVQVLEPVWMPTLIDQTYSSLKGRGIHKGVKDVKEMLRDVEGTRYCLKMDVRKFYPSIDHAILKRMLRRKIKDDNALWLLDGVIDSIPGEKNVPIGNYLSQFFGNIYLSGFDHWMKEEMGVKHYLRYCDDIVVFGSSKELLGDLRAEVERYLSYELKLVLKDNWQVFPTRVRGLDFLGYRFFGGRTLLRKSTALQLKRAMTEISNGDRQGETARGSIASYEGWLGWCDGSGLYRSYVEPAKARMGG